jgi:exosortase N
MITSLKKYLFETFDKQQIITLLIMLLIAALSVSNFIDYFQVDFKLILILGTLPFVLRKQSDSGSLRYGYFAIFMFLISIHLEMTTLYLFAVIFSLFFVFEFRHGKLQTTPLMIILLVTPAVGTLVNLVGFEFRLYLTKIAVQFLNILPNSNYVANGNILLNGDYEYHVDPACIGLNMTIFSFFIALLFYSYFQNKLKKKSNFVDYILLIVFAFILNLISNLFRIILLTVLDIHPESIAHDIIGILCLVAYVVIPLWYSTRLWFKYKKENVTTTTPTKTPNKIHSYSILIILFLFLLAFLLFIDTGNSEKAFEVSNDYLEQNFEYQEEEFNVHQYTNDNCIIYIKPKMSFYSMEHSPLICWRGCGYSIKKGKIVQAGNHDVFFSELESQGDKLYSVWWYDDGSEKTNSQIIWRTKSLLFNKKFYIINVVSDDKEKVIQEAGYLIQQEFNFEEVHE